jgi:hypothetical protein
MCPWRINCDQLVFREVVIVMSSSPAFVVMMQTTDFSDFNDLTLAGSLCPSALWCVLAQRQMSAPAMVLGTE